VASPAIGADGKIYVGSKDSIFYAFESNGSVAWEYFAGEPITSSAALGQDGTIYFGDENGTFHAVNPDGSPKWTYEVEDVVDTNKSILSSPALDLSGNIYFGSGNGNCYSITDNGESASLNWSFPAFDRVDASPVLGINDEVFFVSRDGYLRSLSTLTGNLNWDAFVGDVFYSSPGSGCKWQDLCNWIYWRR
jgi:outer membrane protein assembly factor BamB